MQKLVARYVMRDENGRSFLVNELARNTDARDTWLELADGSSVQRIGAEEFKDLVTGSRLRLVRGD